MNYKPQTWESNWETSTCESAARNQLRRIRTAAETDKNNHFGNSLHLQANQSNLDNYFSQIGLMGNEKESRTCNIAAAMQLRRIRTVAETEKKNHFVSYQHFHANKSYLANYLSQSAIMGNEKKTRTCKIAAAMQLRRIRTVAETDKKNQFVSSQHFQANKTYLANYLSQITIMGNEKKTRTCKIAAAMQLRKIRTAAEIDKNNYFVSSLHFQATQSYLDNYFSQIGIMGNEKNRPTCNIAAAMQLRRIRTAAENDKNHYFVSSLHFQVNQSYLDNYFSQIGIMGNEKESRTCNIAAAMQLRRIRTAAENDKNHYFVSSLHFQVNQSYLDNYFSQIGTIRNEKKSQNCKIAAAMQLRRIRPAVKKVGKNHFVDYMQHHSNGLYLAKYYNQFSTMGNNNERHNCKIAAAMQLRRIRPAARKVGKNHFADYLQHQSHGLHLAKYYNQFSIMGNNNKRHNCKIAAKMEWIE